MKAGWKTVKLGHIGVHVKGSSMPAKESRFESWSVPSFETGQPEIVSGSSILAAKTPVEVGDVLICKINPRINRVWRVTETGNKLPRICSTEWVVFRANNPSEVLPQWVQIYCSSPAFREWITGQITGTTGSHARAKPSNIFDQEIPLPPLAEQKRIVALLDEAFAGIDKAKAKAEDGLNRIQVLFESHLQTIFTQRGPGWVERRLGEVSRINYGYTESASAEMIGPHFLRITDIQEEGVEWSTVPYCRIDKDDLPKYKLSDGDIVFARTGATTGKSYLVSNPPDSVFASYLIRVQLSEKALLPGFLYLFFQTRSYWDVIRAGVSGSTQGGFNASKLGELTVPYPASLSEQNVVIRSVSEIQDDTLMAGKLAKTKLQALTELKASILAQAFAGELTA